MDSAPQKKKKKISHRKDMRSMKLNRAKTAKGIGEPWEEKVQLARAENVIRYSVSQEAINFKALTIEMEILVLALMVCEERSE